MKELHVNMDRYQRACQIWAVLAWAAKSRQNMTYTQLAQLTGVHIAGLGKLLEPIQSYCLLSELPPLTILVVKDSGLPGTGFTGATVADFAGAMAKVYSEDWLEHGNPQPEKLKAAAVKLPSNGSQRAKKIPGPLVRSNGRPLKSP